MVKGKCSKIIADERSEKLENGFTVFYGAKDNTACNVIEITVKGLFTPLENKKNYQKDASDASVELQHSLSEMLSHEDGIDKHFIVSTDFTERGIKTDSRCKFKYQMYVRPLEVANIDNNKSLVITIVSHANEIVYDVLESHGFSVAE